MLQFSRCRTFEHYADWLAQGLGRPPAKFVRDMILGIHGAKSVNLTDVARALEEGKRLHGKCFRVPQDCDRKAELKSFQVSIDSVEAETGLDFFHLLPDEIENKLERSLER